MKVSDLAKSRAKSLLADGKWSHNFYDAQGREEIVAKLIQSALDKFETDAYGRGVTAGKMEALKYTPEERERYGRWTGGSIC